MRTDMTTLLEPQPLYRQIAVKVETLIDRGTFQIGDRLPSVRSMSKDWGVSITTVLEAYRQLESRGVIETRPQSGHYVRMRAESLLPEPEETAPPAEPRKLSMAELTRLLSIDAADPDLPKLGLAVPNPAHLPVEKLNRMLSAAARRLKGRGLDYEFVPGAKLLRIEIARRMAQLGCNVGPNDILITSGATEAINLAIQGLLKPGDSVLVESPSYCGFYRGFEQRGVKVLEVPTHPKTGLSIEAVRYALEQNSCVRACMLVPNFNNPLGSLMPEENKRALVKMMSERGIPIIEDDVYGDLSYSDERPKPLMAYDTKGIVTTISSFSKTLAPGYRVGWIASRRFHSEFCVLKTQWSCATATLPQYAIADFLTSGGYDAHIRRMRRLLESQTGGILSAVGRHFPEGTRVTRPLGGFVVWVELPESVDCLDLYRLARQEHVTFAPGVLFSAAMHYRNCIRLNTCFAGEKSYAAIERLGRLAKKLSGG